MFSIICPTCNSILSSTVSLNSDSIFVSSSCSNDHSFSFSIDNTDINSLFSLKHISSDKFNEDLYWAFVSKINWTENYKLNNSYDKVVRETIIPYTDNIHSLYKFYSSLFASLMNVFDDYVQNTFGCDYPFGDDSTNDFISHICSLSKKDFYFYLNNPAELYELANKKGSMSESFDYIWLDV